MKASRLHEVWASPDNTRLTPKQYSFRLPLHVAAKLAALGEIYPNRSRTQIVADLLSSALEEVEAHLPQGVGDRAEGDLERMLQEEHGYAGEELYYLGGPKGRFRSSANKHYRDLEVEAGGQPTDPLFGHVIGTVAEFTKTAEQ